MVWTLRKQVHGVSCGQFLRAGGCWCNNYSTVFEDDDLCDIDGETNTEPFWLSVFEQILVLVDVTSALFEFGEGCFSKIYMLGVRRHRFCVF